MAGVVTAGCSSKTQRAYVEGQTAQSLFDAGNLPAALNAINRALALRDDQIDLILLSGRIRYRMGDYSGAFDAYNMALAIDPMNPEALQAVSQIGASIGHDAESASATDRILSVEPNNASALLIKGVGMLNHHDYAGAEAIGDKMLKADAQSEPGVVLKARAMFLSDRQADALALLRDALKRLGPKQMIVTALLECARDQGDSALMLDQFRALGEIVPDNVDLTIDEANLDYKLGHVDDARKRGAALLAKHGDDLDAVARLANLWTEYDATPLDRGQIDDLASNGPPAARLAVARFLLGKGDTTSAAALIGSLPGGEATGMRARIAYAENGDTGPAEKVLTTDQSNCDALSVRAIDALKQQDPTKSVIAAQEVASQCPERDGFDLLANAYRAKGNAVAVRQAYLDASRARPLDTVRVDHFAAWLIESGDRQEAVNVARRLTQRAPAKISAWQLLGKVCTKVGDKACIDEARAGEAAARRNFAMDLPPGQRRPNPLLGSSWR
ncbi:MAG: tetratricopeptide repeat protein [Sphingomonas sp.]|uniref:tetratricopeptide repeat protein n=1 Tax=Sphingomonas sp. TaxID=28214 RepID=UPI001ACED61D|nr:tetratricopeptide repeat protein [Sphingomonas sp.]MBN8808860.1 tetratricopeptide repeat protein [Sphingomonas sp.]